MRKEAEAHAEEDRRKRELIDARNQADQMVYQVEKLLKDNAGKLSEADRGPGAGGHREGQGGDGPRRRAGHPPGGGGAAAGVAGDGAAHAGPADGRRRGGDLGQRPRRPGRRGKDDVIDADFEVKK